VRGKRGRRGYGEGGEGRGNEGRGRQERGGIREAVMTLSSNATRRGNIEVILIGKPHECVPCRTAIIVGQLTN